MLRAVRCLARAPFPIRGRAPVAAFVRPRYCSFTVYFNKDGEDGSVAVKAKEGQTLLEVAHENDIDIEGACGGECACSTCHVILEEDAFSKLPAPDDDEAEPDRGSSHWLRPSFSKLTWPRSQRAAKPQEQAMARVAVFNMEIVGTVNPVLPVVAELVKQGCDVRYYLSKDTFAKDVADLGANVYKFDDFFPRWAELLESKEEAAWLSAHYPEGVPEPSASGVPMRMLYYSLPAGVCLGRRLLETWSSWRPEIVLYNCMLLHPYLAARKLGIPTCSFSTYPGPGTPMHLYALKPQEREAFDQSLAQSPGLRPANEIAKEFFGVDVFESQLLCRFFSPDRNLVFSIPELQGVVEKHQEKRLVSSSFRWVGSTDPELSCSAGVNLAWQQIRRHANLGFTD
ncbi:unnamed protein product [Effrenium voratum]|nr:unnamed protein product [Effrenium voratum]